MIISRQRLFGFGLAIAVAVVAQVMFGGNDTVSAAQVGTSYFENRSGGALPWTGSTELPAGSNDCVTGLFGYVVPNNTRPDNSKGSHRCDGTGAVGDVRMDATSRAMGYWGGDRRIKFYQMLKYNYNSGSAWERAGSSQIALTLLGQGFGGAHNRTITAAQWQDLYDRITAPDIEIMWTSQGGCPAGSTWCIPGGAPFRYNTAGVRVGASFDAIRVDNGPATNSNRVDAWVFRSVRTKAVYGTFEIECGNGIGTTTGLPRAAQWNLSLADAHISEINPVTKAVIKAYAHNEAVAGVPGKSYGFYYRWVNNGADATNTTTYMRRDYNYPGTGRIVDPAGSYPHAPGVAAGGGWMYSGMVGWMTVKVSDVDKKYCMRTMVNPGSSSDSGVKYSSGGAVAVFPGSYLCVSVDRSFDLIPTVTVAGGSIPPGNPTISAILPKVTNSGPTDSYPNSYWQIVRFVVPVGSTKPAGGEGQSIAPCDFYNRTKCKMLDEGHSTFGMPTTNLPTQSDSDLTDLVPGQWVCYALSVKGYNAAHNPATATEYRYGTPICRQVAKQPSVQIWGGDLRSRGKVTSSVSTMGGVAQYGSWVEYGAFSTGVNANLASGSGLSGGSTIPSVAERSKLTFANRGGSYGRYDVPAAPSLVARFSAVTPTKPMAGSNVASYASGTYKTSANVTISGGVIGQAAGVGKTIVIISSKKVTITGNLTYAGPGAGGNFTNIKQIPQLIIIAKDIDIQGGVEEVNAWLLTSAGGAINTCSDVALTDGLSSKVCDKPLVVNGPVATDTLYLRRTAGADNAATANDPAERFNLRADAYLWAHGHSTQTGRVQTDKITEMAPRF